MPDGDRKDTRAQRFLPGPHAKKASFAVQGFYAFCPNLVQRGRRQLISDWLVIIALPGFEVCLFNEHFLPDPGFYD